MKNIKRIAGTAAKLSAITTLTLLFSACSGFFDKDNTPDPSPLVKFTPEVKTHSQWQTSAGNDVGNDYLKLTPAITDRAIFTSSYDGDVVSTDKLTGKSNWHANAGVHITGGTAAQDGLVFVGSREGDVIALQQSNGKPAWRAKVSSEVLAAPAASNGVVLIKTIDGKLSALSAQDGHELWLYQEAEPLLILRGASTPKISGNNVIVGFANGSLSRLTLHEGSQHWHQAIAIPEGSFAIQRMIDIDADPIIFKNRIYAATYQGKVASLDMTTGKQHWDHDISSYTGLVADNDKVYVSDAKGHVWAFEANSGNVFWRQNQLEYRNISGPALIGNYLVVGDGEGYLHFLNKQDGHFVARVHVDGSGILAAPIVDNNVIYVFTKGGRLAAYTLG
jgi:outer membrane protein assembly factor BamB